MTKLSTLRANHVFHVQPQLWAVFSTPVVHDTFQGYRGNTYRHESSRNESACETNGGNVKTLRYNTVHYCGMRVLDGHSASLLVCSPPNIGYVDDNIMYSNEDASDIGIFNGALCIAVHCSAVQCSMVV